MSIYKVIWRPNADAERAAVHDPAERLAIQHAREKLEILGPKLAAPHCSAVKGEEVQVYASFVRERDAVAGAQSIGVSKLGSL